MTTAVIRTVILYFFVILFVRLMGKRQIGQLQPSELVITFLLSEIASLPLEDQGIPLIVPIVCVCVLVSLEILLSYLSLSNSFIRRITQGNALFIIKEGKVDLRQMKRLRFTVEDLMEAVRQKDIFDLTDIEYAIVETNGTLSVLTKAGRTPPNREDLKIRKKDDGIPCVVISNGEIVESNFSYCGMNRRKLANILMNEKKTADEIMIMTCDKGGNYYIVEKEEGR
ncbi:MAG: DUF421 domain-containing protein [Clostridia bacterium]|nr:DUF421 domain-containing protein [Clostridia bacterium]